MRAYHFMEERWGLESLRRHRLKLALFEDMNDPFELLGAGFRDKCDEATYPQLKAEMHLAIGVLCFSRTWHDPVLWSHYADKHRGLCLGFDIPDEWAKQVKYRWTRLGPEPENYQPRNDKDTFGYKLLTTKFRHWEYEDEVRLIVQLKHAESEEQRYFLPYGNALKLREVVVGPRSSLLVTQLRDSIQSEHDSVSVYYAGLARRSFRVVRDRFRK
jgi:hypothetical protein